MDEARGGLDGLVAPHTAGGYERVRFTDNDGKKNTVLLARVRESTTLLTGIEVDREGEAISGKGFDERRRVIDKTLVAKRTTLKMDNKYAALVVDAQGRIDLGKGWWAMRAENEGPRGGKISVFSAWHESQPEDVLTFVHLRGARTWAQEHEGARRVKLESGARGL